MHHPCKHGDYDLLSNSNHYSFSLSSKGLDSVVFMLVMECKTHVILDNWGHQL